MKIALALLCFSAGSAAAAADGRVVVAPFEGAGGERLREQVRASVCRSVRCAPANLGVTADGLDWGEIQARGVRLVVLGKVTRRDGSRVLDFRVMDGTGGPVLRQVLALNAQGRLAAPALLKARRGVLRGLTSARGGAPGAEDEEVVASRSGDDAPAVEGSAGAAERTPPRASASGRSMNHGSARAKRAADSIEGDGGSGPGRVAADTGEGEADAAPSKHARSPRADEVEASDADAARSKRSPSKRADIAEAHATDAADAAHSKRARSSRAELAAGTGDVDAARSKRSRSSRADLPEADATDAADGVHSTRSRAARTGGGDSDEAGAAPQDGDDDAGSSRSIVARGRSFGGLGSADDAETAGSRSASVGEVVAAAADLERPDSRWLSLEIGAAVATRQVAYERLGTPELAAGRETAAAPRVSASAFPFGRGARAGFGLEASFAASVDELTGSGGRTRLTQLDVVAAYGVKPLSALPVWLRAQLGGRWHAFAGAAPASDYRAWRAGAAVEIALGERLRLSGEGAYLGVLSTGTLLPYFPRARPAAAVEASGGLALRVTDELEITGAARYALYRHDLDADPGDLYVANSAADAYLTGTVGVRFTF